MVQDADLATSNSVFNSWSVRTIAQGPIQLAVFSVLRCSLFFSFRADVWNKNVDGRTSSYFFMKF